MAPGGPTPPSTFEDADWSVRISAVALGAEWRADLLEVQPFPLYDGIPHIPLSICVFISLYFSHVSFFRIIYLFLEVLFFLLCLVVRCRCPFLQ